MARYVAALDQGTTSTRCMLFDRAGAVVTVAQREHEQLLPQPGWVEHDAKELWFRSDQVIRLAMQQAGASVDDIAALGITNQRETTVVWDRASGEPISPAITWQDTRSDDLCKALAAGPPLAGAGSGSEDDPGAASLGARLRARWQTRREHHGGGVAPAAAGQDRFRALTGLPIAPYFSASKIMWLLEHVPGARERAQRGELLFGTVDTWLLWHLTGGPAGGVHATDVTNASRTLLMGLESLDWDERLLEATGVPRAMLPEIRPSVGSFGEVTVGPLAGVPIAGILGDQQAATFGQTCFAPGEAKNTYGTGNFLLLNTGEVPVQSKHGLITTVGYQLNGERPVYCLEGSIAITGSLVQWLRDNLGMISGSEEIETLAGTVDDNGGAYFVPAFSGLYAPHWRQDARGVIAGLTRFVKSGHIARAVLEATAFQSREVVEAMALDAGVPLTTLKVDGGMTVNDLLMQFQADILGVPVIRPKVTETTALGAAYAAGLATGFWSGLDELREHWAEDARWTPAMPGAERDARYAYWRKAVQRTLDWAE